MTTSKILIAATWAVSLIQSARPAFDVASIRPSRTNGAWFWDVTPGGRVVCRNCTLKRMILLAYRLQEYQVVGGPAWVSNDEFDVEAKPDSGANPTNEQSRQMLQSLLEQRFHLQVEMEDKSGPIYAIVTVKNGPPRSADQSTPVEAPPSDPNGSMPRGAMRVTSSSAVGNAVPIPLLARFLGQMLGRPVIDKTGLTGRYDIDVHWTPEFLPHDAPPAGAPADGPSLFTALQEQVGLKLQSTTGPVQQLVIKGVERPSEN